ncbi:MAG: discoidin domain-containing protein, partial [Bryobacteraceae bacterium]
MRRREFVGTVLLGGAAGRAGVPQGPADGGGEERMTWPTGDGYEAPVGTAEDEVRWVQVDLGSPRKIDAVKLYPKFNPSPPRGLGFPVRFRIDISDDPQFAAATPVSDHTSTDLADPIDRIQTFAAHGAQGRYVRVTATRLRAVPPPRRSAAGAPPSYRFSLAKMDVISGGQDIAVGRPIADSSKGELGVTPLTRPARPQGETIVTDNPGN